jgi:hypothetical protein
MHARHSLVTLALSLAAVAAPAAQAPVPALQDLMGAKGASVETSLTSRGYTYVGRGPGAQAEIEYWRAPQANACVGVRYQDNRVQAVVQSPNAECVAAAANKPKAPAPTAAGFSTVCGVTVDGKTYRYRCTVEGAPPATAGQTTALHFPDNSVTLKWLGGNRASATFAGMNPVEVTVTSTEGVTTFTFEGKPYFWVSDRTAAALELKSVR